MRALTLKYYDGQCGFCDVSDTKLLVAGHIARWGDEPEARGNLSNVICMCSFHDVLFENGYFGLRDDYSICTKENVTSRMILQILNSTKALRTGTPYPPSPVFLRKHRTRSRLEA